MSNNVRLIKTYSMKLWIATALSLACCCWTFQTVDAQVRVRLKSGGYVAGELTGNASSGHVGIGSGVFAEPIELDLRAIRSIDQLDRNLALLPVEQSFLLSGGNSLSGKLLAMDATKVTVQSPALGEVTFPREMLRELIDSRFEGRLVYSGPRSGKDWTSAEKPEDWVFEAGSISTSKAGVCVVGDVNLPDRCEVRFSLSWTKTPDFALYLGCDGKTKADDSSAALCLEIWDGALTMVREVGQNAEIALVSEYSAENNRLNLVAYLDQVEGIAAVATPNGRLLERIQLKSDKVKPARFVKLCSQGQENHQSVFRLERFEVRDWDGHLPSGTGEATGQVISADGSAVDGELGNFNSQTGEVEIVRADKTTTTMKLAEIRRAQFKSTAELKSPEAASADDANTEKKDDATAADKPNENAPIGSSGVGSVVEVELIDRSRLSGIWLESIENKVQFEVAGFDKPVVFELNKIVGLIGDGEPYAAKAAAPVNLNPKGRLVTEFCELPGAMGMHDSGSLKTFLWQADGAAKAVVLSEASEGKVEFGNPSSSAAARNKPATQAQPRAALPGLQRTTTRAAAIPRARRLTIGLEFRTGDVVEGTVKSIDEKGVTFESASTTTKFVPHDKLESVTLRPNRDAVNETPQKLERLMIVPRSMKADPPTHLFVSANGDYLRGRLISLDATKTVIEVRLENVEIPTEQLAQIYWLHDRSWETAAAEKAAKDEAAKEAGTDVADEASTKAGDATAKPETVVAAKPEKEAAAKPAEFLVHTIRKDGRGLTFAPQALSEGKLSGSSFLLGACEQPLAELQSILFGRDVGAQARSLKKELWTLSLAQLPKVYEEGESASGEDQSPLVGKPAPDFKLQSLDDAPFQLSKQTGKVIVLDFWASWCGPCMKTMPEVDRVVKEVGGNEVELVAINLQEGKDRINTAMGRLAIAANVLMDVDGEVAQLYQANAIPQTVIIDRNGTVTHLFVGGGTKFVEQFSTALKATLEAK